MKVKEFLKQRRENIIQIASKHGAYNIRVFGSVARGEEGAASDIDLLVDIGERISPWFPAGFITDLEKLLGYKVEVVTKRGLDPHIRENVLEEAIPL